MDLSPQELTRNKLLVMKMFFLKKCNFMASQIKTNASPLGTKSPSRHLVWMWSVLMMTKTQQKKQERKKKYFHFILNTCTYLFPQPILVYPNGQSLQQQVTTGKWRWQKKSFDKRNYFPNFVFTSYTVTVMKKLSTAAIFLIQFDNKAKLSSL